MRSNRTARCGRRRTGPIAVAASVSVTMAAAMGITGCSGGGHGFAKPAAHTSATGASGTVGSPSATGPSGWQPPGSTSSPSWTYAIDAAITRAPAEFAHPPRWSVPVTLSHDGLAGFGNPVIADAVATSSSALMANQVKVGMIAVVGNEVAVPSFGVPADAASSTPLTLSVELLDGKTGKALATVPVADAEGYYGMDAVTIGGKSAVEVRYRPKPTGATTAQFASIVLDQAGNRLWSSAGQQLSGPVTNYNGLVGDQNTGFVAEGGFVERVADPDPLDTRRTKAVVSVLDLTGRTVMTVPAAGGKSGSSNSLQLVGGYAVESSFTASSDPSGPATASPARFTVYDLVHGAKKVASLTQPIVLPASPSGGNWRHVLAVCGNRLLMQWPQISQSYSAGTSSVDLAVLDLATGRTTAPVAVPSDVVGGNLLPALQAAGSPDCSTVLVTGTVGVSRQAAVAVDWATGKARWQHLGPATVATVTPQPSFQPLVLQGGVVYGLQSATSGNQVTATALSLADGQPRGTSAGLNPVAFTTDGAPVFIQYDQGTPSAPTPRPTPSTRLNFPPSAAQAPDLYPMTVWVGATAG